MLKLNLYLAKYNRYSYFKININLNLLLLKYYNIKKVNKSYK